MAGDILIPPLVIHRKIISDAVYEEGRRNGQDFMIRLNETFHVTRPVFPEYLNNVILQYFATTRQGWNLRSFRAFSSVTTAVHTSDEDIKWLLARHNIRLIAFSPHTSHLFRLLNLATIARNARDISINIPDLKFDRSPNLGKHWNA
jgi:hypothetical protein